MHKVYQILPMNIWWILMILCISTLFILTSLNFMNFNPKKKEKDKSDKSFYTKKMVILGLFSSFDPCSSISFIQKELNWLIMILIITILWTSFWITPTRTKVMWMITLKYIMTLFEIALKQKKDGSSLIFPSLFIFFMMCNILGLNPNLFTPSSHINLNMMISLPLWLGFLMYGWKQYTKKMLAHLVPSGTPTPLISFMVLIELISTFIRPLTLSIRLMANMVSGHLLLTLMGNSMSSLMILGMSCMVLIQCMLTSLEIGVALIQAYVFCTLLTLYSDDSDYFNKKQ